MALQARALSISGGISVNATNNTCNGWGGSVEAHGVGHICPNDHEGLVFVGKQLRGIALTSQKAVLPTQLGIDLQHQVATVLLAFAGVRWEPVICNDEATDFKFTEAMTSGCRKGSKEGAVKAFTCPMAKNLINRSSSYAATSGPESREGAHSTLGDHAVPYSSYQLKHSLGCTDSSGELRQDVKLSQLAARP